MVSHYVGFWRRGIAFFIDGLILAIVWGILMFLGFLALWIGFPPRYGVLLPENILDLGVRFVFLYGLTVVLIHMLYFTYFHGTTGQTPGKMILGMRVVLTTGEDMTVGIGFLRWVGYFVSVIFCGIGFFWILIDGRKQGWHDKIAGTIVVSKVNIEDTHSEAGDEKYLDKDGEIL